MQYRLKKFLEITLFILIFVFVYNSHEMTVSTKHNISKQELELHNKIVRQYFARRKDWDTSNLGSILIKNADPRLFIRKHATKTFVISVRSFHLEETMRFANFPNDTLDGCSVKNCIFTDDHRVQEEADAIIIIIRNGVDFVPDIEKRNPKQIWILFSEESPMNTVSTMHPTVEFINNTIHLKYENVIKLFSNIFNWTMTFRSDSDVPVPYGRTVALPQPVDVDLTDVEKALATLVPFWQRKQFAVMSSIMMSNCGILRRNEVLYKLLEYMKIDLFGKCWETDVQNKCFHRVNAEWRPDCNATETYIFYLVFENSSCRQYMTEKCFHNAYSKGAIPVILGPPLIDCINLLPPNSFLHVNSYKSLKDLVYHMTDIFTDLNTLLSFHAWRKNFAVLNEHGYFGTASRYYCRVCEALNYNDGETKIYDFDELSLHLNQNILCDLTYNFAKQNST